jgi:hypothetical protein
MKMDPLEMKAKRLEAKRELKEMLYKKIKILSRYGPVEVITGLSGVCIISPPGELVSPDAESGEPDYMVESTGWALLPEGGNWQETYNSLEELWEANKDDILALE